VGIEPHTAVVAGVMTAAADNDDDDEEDVDDASGATFLKSIMSGNVLKLNSSFQCYSLLQTFFAYFIAVENKKTFRSSN
jgi:hypothetical protein